jgi:Uncharacterised nucleotidyltransferase
MIPIDRRDGSRGSNAGERHSREGAYGWKGSVVTSLLNLRSMPPYFPAVLGALQFQEPSVGALKSLSDEQWRQALEFCDLAHLTLLLRGSFQKCAPAWVLSRVDQNLVDNRKRLERIKAAYSEIAQALTAANVEHVVVKGFAQCPDFVEDAESRVQSDIDLYCPNNTIGRAHDALVDLGYEATRTLEGFPSDHLPVMIKKTGWKWKGNAYDPEMPPSVDLHFSLWNTATNRLIVDGVNEFWGRRGLRHSADFSFPALSRVDNLGFCALHVVRDLQRGDWVIHHVYELAWFLHRHAKNKTMWLEWIRSHDKLLRSLEVIPFWLAREWFQCDVSPLLKSEIARLSPFSEQWLTNFSTAPLGSMFRPNKVGVWLHVGLLPSKRDKLAVLREALLPSRLPAVGAPGQNATKSRRTRRWWPSNTYVRYACHVIFRGCFHLSRLVPTLWRGIELWLIGKEPCGCCDLWEPILEPGCSCESFSTRSD